VTPIPQFATSVGQIAAPKNKAELDALSDQRDELREQLESLNERREDLAQQIGRIGSDDVVRSGPVARLRILDQQIQQLETKIEQSDRLITEAKGKGIGGEHAPGPQVIRIPEIPTFEFEHMPGVTQPPTPWYDRLGPLATTVPITLASIALLGALMYWRISRSVRNQLSKIMAAQSGRLEELQRSVDTVAVEMERVSENQRFVTKLVGEKAPAPSVDRR
jgi:hypothetical protein